MESAGKPDAVHTLRAEPLQNFFGFRPSDFGFVHSLHSAQQAGPLTALPASTP